MRGFDGALFFELGVGADCEEAGVEGVSFSADVDAAMDGSTELGELPGSCWGASPTTSPVDFVRFAGGQATISRFRFGGGRSSTIFASQVSFTRPGIVFIGRFAVSIMLAVSFP
jgi:hypothetical protein